VGGALHGAGLQAAAPHAPSLRAREQPGALEDAKVLVHARERDTERPGELADGRFAYRQLRQDGAPRRVGEGREYRIELGSSMFNHMVK